MDYSLLLVIERVPKTDNNSQVFNDNNNPKPLSIETESEKIQ